MKHRNLLLGLLAGALLAGGGAAAIHFRRAPLRALRSPDYAVCANAIVEVAEAGRTDAIPHLIEILGSRRPSPVPGWNARWGLVKLGVPLTDDKTWEGASVRAWEGAVDAPTLPPSHPPTNPDLIQPAITLERVSVDEGVSQVVHLKWKLEIPLGCPFRVLPASPDWRYARRYGVPREREVVASAGFPPPHVRIAVYRRDPAGASGAWVHHAESWHLSLDEAAPPDAGGAWEATEDLVPPPGPGPALAVVEVPAMRIEDLAPDCPHRRGAGIHEGDPLRMLSAPVAAEIILPASQ